MSLFGSSTIAFLFATTLVVSQVAAAKCGPNSKKKIKLAQMASKNYFGWNDYNKNTLYVNVQMNGNEIWPEPMATCDAYQFGNKVDDSADRESWGFLEDGIEHKFCALSDNNSTSSGGYAPEGGISSGFEHYSGDSRYFYKQQDLHLTVRTNSGDGQKSVVKSFPDLSLPMDDWCIPMDDDYFVVVVASFRPTEKPYVCFTGITSGFGRKPKYNDDAGPDLTGKPVRADKACNRDKYPSNHFALMFHVKQEATW